MAYCTKIEEIENHLIVLTIWTLKDVVMFLLWKVSILLKNFCKTTRKAQVLPHNQKRTPQHFPFKKKVRNFHPILLSIGHQLLCFIQK